MKHRNEEDKRQGRMEIRAFACEPAIGRREGSAQGESRTVEGTAIVFNSESEVLDESGQTFREVIAPEAVTQAFLDTQDIKMNLLHERSATIARCNRGQGSLRLSVDERGVHFAFEAPRCDVGERCLELVRRGDYSGCSFEFYPEEWETEYRNQGRDVLVRHTRLRAITALTIGMDPAYRATSVNVRELLDASPEAAAERNRRDGERAKAREAMRIRRAAVALRAERE